ncbi:MAG: HNH endonuclease, partial [Planctomycetota bacterium]
MGHEAGGRANAEAQASADGAARGHVETIRLVEGLPERDLIRHIHYFRRKGEVGHRGLAFYLLDLHKRGLYRPKAKSAAKWAAKELDLHVKFARRLIHTARKLEELKRTDRLFAEGKLPWTKVEIIASVATAKTEAAWIDYATRHGYAELRDVAARARKKEDALPGDGLGVGRAMLTVRQKVSALAHEVYERALARARDALGPGATPAEAFQKLCEMALGAAEPKEGDPASGGSPKGAPRGTPSPYTVVVHVDPEGIYVLEDGPDGRPIRRPVPPEDLARILASGARVVAVPPIAVEGEVETIAFGERGTVPREERAPPVSAEERELVLLREGLRCFACGSKDDLTIAHLVARAKGGGNGLRFLAAACKRCHGGEHEGFIRFFGERGRLKALDREGRPLDASVSDAEALALGADAVASDDSDTPLLLLEVPEAKSPSGSDVLPADGEVGPSAAEELPFSVRDLPAEIDAATWRELQDYLEWSPSRRAYLVRSERGRPPFA